MLHKKIKNCFMKEHGERKLNYRKQPPEVFCKKVFSEISQNSPGNTCARASFLMKLQAPPATLLKKRLWYRCILVNFAKFLRTPFSETRLGDCFLIICIHELKMYLRDKIHYPTVSYLITVNKKNTRAMREICSKLKIKTP